MLLGDGRDFTSQTKKDTYPFIDPTKLNLSGKTVFITGASKGIGAAIAASFVKAGASTIGLGARSENLLTNLASSLSSLASATNRPPPRILTYALDVTSSSSVSAAASAFSIDASGHLDILIANAGYMADHVPLLDSDPAEWWRTWEVNINGIYLTTRFFLPIMMSSPTSTRQILYISAAGAHHAVPGGSSYFTSKLAVLRFAEILSNEYGRPLPSTSDDNEDTENSKIPGLLTYSIHPGATMTELGHKFLRRQNLIPLDDTPELAGDTIAWLTSVRREWLAGRYVSVNWDMEEFMEKVKEMVEKKDLLKVGFRVE